jgi:formate C-acetyltransferase
LSRDGAKRLLADFWFKVEDAGQIQNMTLGGVDGAGRPIYSDLTLLCLEVTRELAFKGPNLCLRVSSDMPGYIWEAALESIKTGSGLPALYNDALYTNSLLAFGYDIKYARGYCFAGCSQLMIPGVCNFYNDIGMANAAKIAEISLYDGFDPRTGKQVGEKTGAPEKIQSFDEVLAAYKKQLDYFCGLEVSIHEKEYRYRASREGYAMRTLFTGDCIEKGKNVFDGGARFSGVELEVIGITNAADHLYAIKELVFDKQIVDLPTLAKILKDNWKDNETLRKLALQCGKFGNDNPKADELRADITEHIYANFNNAKSSFGGIYMPGEVIFTAHDWCGAATGATADGRLSGSVLADSAGSSQGLDKSGPTALLASVLKIPADKHLLTTAVTNIKFPAGIFADADAALKIQKLFEVFFSGGGMQLQINVCDAETLKKAQADPQNYASLIVRVGGYSDYFVNISKALQDEIIIRSSQRV